MKTMRSLRWASARGVLLMTVALSFALTACTDMSDDPVGPDIPTPVPDETLSDTYLPGDNFYLYCNDKWIAQQTVDFSGIDARDQFYGHFPTEAEAVFMQQMETIVSPTFEKLKNDFVADNNAYIRNRQLIDQATKRLADCKTKEELWVTAGQMIKEGYPSAVMVTPFNLKGRLTLVFTTSGTIPQPAEVRAATRGSSTETWPLLAKMCEGLGIDTEYAYVVADNPIALDDLFSAEDDELLLALQNATLEQSIQFFIKGLSELDAYCNPEKMENDSWRQRKLEQLDGYYLTYEKTKLYCDKYISAEARQKAIDICETLRTAFAKRMEDNPWMSSGTKANALKKLNAMVFNIGSPDQWITEALPDISQKQTLVEDVVELRRAFMALRLTSVGKTSKEMGFHSLVLQTIASPLFMNDNYDPNFNCINIFPPFMQVLATESNSLTAEDFANYSVVGHEITHGFDTTGSLYNELGDLESIWDSEADAQEYNRRVEMLNDCYNHLEMVPGVMSDGTFCAAENIADLGGFVIAFDACKDYFTAKGYSGERLNEELRRFYIAYAKFYRAKYSADYATYYYNKDEHSMPQERVNGVVSNTNAWYDLFDIRPDSKLYRSPDQRVHIW